SDEEVVQRANHRLEEGADIAVEFFARQFSRRLVEPRIGPSVVGRHHREMLLHRVVLTASRSLICGGQIRNKPQERNGHASPRGQSATALHMARRDGYRARHLPAFHDMKDTAWRSNAPFP